MGQQPGPGQRPQQPLGLLLVGGQQRRRGGGAQARPPGQREPAQQPPGLLGLVGVAQPQRPLHRLDRTVPGQTGGEVVAGAGAERGARYAQRERQPAAQLRDGVRRPGVVRPLLRGPGRLAQQFLRAGRVERADRQLMDPGGDVVRQPERLPGGDQDEAVGALRDQGAHLRRVTGVVEDDRHGGTGQVLVVQLAQPPHLLLGRRPAPGRRVRPAGGRRPVPEQQLLTGRAQPVQQMQQRVAGRQRCLTGHIAAQIDHAGTAEQVLQTVRGPHRERGASGAGRAVQNDDGGFGLRRSAGLPHPLRDLRQFGTPSRERPVTGGQMTERLLQERAGAGRRAAVRAAR